MLERNERFPALDNGTVETRTMACPPWSFENVMPIGEVGAEQGWYMAPGPLFVMYLSGAWTT